MAVLVLAEHSNSALNDATAKTVAAAQAFGGDIDVLVAGHNARAAADAAAKLSGVRKVLLAESAAFAVLMGASSSSRAPARKSESVSDASFAARSILPKSG